MKFGLLFLLFLLSVAITLNCLKPIYFGIYEGDKFKEFGSIQPTAYNMEISLQLEEGQEAYYIYCNGFGRITKEEEFKAEIS